MKKPPTPRSLYSPRSDTPLVGIRILVTRPLAQAESLTRPLERLGATTLVQPMVRILPPEDGYLALDSAIVRGASGTFDWIVFASANGVRTFDERRRAMAVTWPDNTVQIAAIGSGTANELVHLGYSVDRIPEKAESDAFAAALEKEAKRGERFLLIRANRGRDTLPRQLARWNAMVESVTAYRSEDVTQPDPGIPADLANVDLVTATSSAIASGIVRVFGDALRRVGIVSISPITTEVLRAAGYPPVAEATEYTMAGVLDAILRYV